MDVRLNMAFDIFICLAWSSWISAVLGVKSRSIPYSLIFYDYVLVLFVLCVCTICLFPYGSDGEFLQIIISICSFAAIYRRTTIVPHFQKLCNYGLLSHY